MEKKSQNLITRSAIILVSFSLLGLFTACGGETKKVQESDTSQINNPENEKYTPKYWLEGIYEKSDDEVSSAGKDLTRVIDKVRSLGWTGVFFWGADRDGAKMNYFFKSPFLEKQEWAVFKKDGLSPLVTAAHKKGIGVMINMEGVNPYHWEKNQWTPENIKAVADDLAADSVDGVFEECFEVKPDVFVSLARELKSKNVDYVSGTDPMLFREANFSTLWPETSIIDIYNYYLKRDKIFNVATLAEHGSLGYGWAKFWGKPTSLISPVNRNWGVAGDYSQAVIPYICMIRALQFRLDNFIIFGGLNTFDPVKTQAWISEYVNKQEKERPLMNIVVLLRKQSETTGSETGEPGWNRFFNSGDALTSGAMNAGYNIVVSDKVLPADAYWVYARGGKDEILPQEVVDLFSTDKPVFIQAGSNIPGGKNISDSWKNVLRKCGVDALKTFSYGAGQRNDEGASLPPDEEQDLPYTGYYKDVYLRVTGSDIQRGVDLRSGTVIPVEAISGTVYMAPNKTYGRGPFITGSNKKYVVTPTCLNWETAYAISDLLSGSGILPSSNVWGIAGRNVTALLAIETTELEMTIPGLAEGSSIHVVVWDNKKNKKSEETLIYKAPFKKMLKEYDFILIDKLN